MPKNKKNGRVSPGFDSSCAMHNAILHNGQRHPSESAGNLVAVIAFERYIHTFFCKEKNKMAQMFARLLLRSSSVLGGGGHVKFREQLRYTMRVTCFISLYHFF